MTAQPQPIRARRTEEWRLPSNLGAGLAALLLALVVPAGGCGANVDGGTLRGSETHFLTRCDAACSDGLDCIGGICTRTCLLSNGSCGDLASGAACTDQSVEPGQAAVCDLGCSETADCGELGAGHVCDAGYCRRGALVSQPMTDPIADVPDESEVPVESGDPDESGGPDGSDLSRAELCRPYLGGVELPIGRPQVSIVNSGPSTLYIERNTGGCNGFTPSLVHVERDGIALNTVGFGCATSCEDVFDDGWTSNYTPANGEPEGNTDVSCPDICMPAPLVPIAPGQTLTQNATLEVTSQEMPQACGEGVVTDTIRCLVRSIPARETYTLRVVAFEAPDCTNATCQPLEFTTQGQWFFEEVTLTLATSE